MTRLDYRIEGATTLRADLRRFAPDLHRDLQRTLTGQATMVAGYARGLLPPTAPLSGWSRAWHGDRLRWDAGRTSAGIKGSTARGRRTPTGVTSVVVVTQTDPAGGVFEVAGRRNPTSRMARQLEARHGPASRAVWRAAETKRATVTAAIAAAVAAAEAALNTRIRSGGL